MTWLVELYIIKSSYYTTKPDQSAYPEKFKTKYKSYVILIARAFINMFNNKVLL